ncbi:MAG: alpha/beta hydrolase [Synergistaceae bacterium]|nr:alpha/beta hydrolase [Synergistaceae bacterium]
MAGFGGMNINYCDRGAGDAVVFLHGWGASYSIFEKFLESMVENYRVVALDLPGFGASDEPPRGWSVDDYAGFVASFLADVGVSCPILIGHSFGGRVIIKLAASGLINIPKIILVDSAGIRPKRTFCQQARSVFYRFVKRLISIDFIQRKFPGALERWRMKHSSADYRSASPMMRECLVKAVNEDLTPCLSSISCPTLLVWGENDADTPLVDGRLMEKLIPDAGLVVLKNAGHYSFLDQSFAFARVLDSFLNIKRPG